MRLGLALALVTALAGIVAATAAALAFDDAVPCPASPVVYVCPGGTVDASYSIQLVGRGGCGPDPPNEGLPYQYRVLNGALPPGLSLSKSGVVSGTPTQAGTYSAWIELSDEDPPSASWCLPKKAEREFSFTINARLLVATESAAPGTLGRTYSLPLAAVMKTGADATAPASSPVTWSLSQGQLPPGLLLDSATGVISGTPTSEGASVFVVRAALVDGRSDTKGLEIIVRQPLSIAAANPLAPTGTAPTPWEVGVPFSAKLSATGGSGTYTWSIAGGALPTGFALAADGTVAGRTEAAGTYRATLRLTDSEGRTADYAAAFNVASRLAISTTKLRTGKVGRLYRSKVATSGGIAPKKWKIKRGPLPRGIRFDRTLGLLSGTPTRPGRYRVTFEATDALKVTASKTLVVEVLASAP
jgi:hypothetical protein